MKTKLTHSFLLLSFVSISSQLLAQLTQWNHFPERIIYNKGRTPIVNPVIIPTPTKDFYGNGIYDSDGNIHFYVYGNRILDRQHNIIHALKMFDGTTELKRGGPDNQGVLRMLQSEIAIVPFSSNRTNMCENKFYVFYSLFNNYHTNNVRYAHLLGCIVTTNALTQEISVEDMRVPQGWMRSFAVSKLSSPNEGPTGIAVSNVIPSGQGEGISDGVDRFLYFLAGGSLQRIRIVPTSANNPYGIENTVTILDHTMIEDVRFNTYELDLSPNGRMLAWGESYYNFKSNNTDTMARTDTNRYNVVYLDAFGFVEGHKKYEIITSDASTSTVRGVEFSADNTKIYMNTAGSDVDDGIYIGNATDENDLSFNYIASSYIASNSMLELASNNRLYAHSLFRTNDVLAAVNTATDNMEPAFNVAVSGLHTMQNWSDGNTSNFKHIPVLPDQIDGMDYTPYLLKRKTFSNVLGFQGIYDRFNISNNTTWTNTANAPFADPNNVRIVRGIDVKKSGNNYGNLTIENLAIQMAPDADITVCNGCKLTLKNVTLTALNEKDCPTNMWEGIKATGGTNSAVVSEIIIEDNTTLRDAITAIKLQGNYIKTNVDNATFTANETNVYIENFGPDHSKSCYRSVFTTYENNIPLIDQHRGSDIGYADSLKRTIYTVRALNNPMQGNVAVQHNCIINGGQYGLFLNNSAAGIASECEFHDIKQTALYIDGNIGKTVVTSNNKYLNCNKSIECKGSSSSSILHVNFNTFEQGNSGVIAYNNNSSTLNVTGTTNVFNDITIPIHLYDNTACTFEITSTRINTKDHETGIKLTGNTNCNVNVSANEINNGDYAVYVENNKWNNLAPSAYKYIIENNTITNPGYYGISLFSNKAIQFDVIDNEIYNAGFAGINTFDNADVVKSEIKIADNLITNSALAANFGFSNTGITIGEPTAGTQKYNTLLVSNNTLDNLARPIVLLNVVGGNGPDPLHNKLSSYPNLHIKNNTIKLNDQILRDPNKGILVQNSPAISCFSNTIKPAPNSGSSFLYGIDAALSENLLLYGNTTETGKGLVVRGNMMNANYYCNTLRRAHIGIQLTNRHWLRSFSNTHGKLNTESRPNEFPQKPAFAINIDVNDRSVDLANRWIFANNRALPSISYTGAWVFNTATGIVAGTGTNICDEESAEWPEDPPYDERFMAINDTALHTVEKFRNKYLIELTYTAGQHAYDSATLDIKQLIRAEKLIAEAKYDNALLVIDSITVEPSDEIMNDFVILYKAYAQYKNNGGNRTMNDSLVDMITPIAVKHPALQSPAAVSARAILWHERNLIFSDSDYAEPYISGYISDSCEQQYLNVNVPFWMEDENYQNTDTLAYTDSTGHFYISAEQLQQLNNTVNYRLVFSIDGTTMRYSAYRSIAEHIIKSDYYFSCNTFGKTSNTLANNTSEITTHPNPASDQFTILTDEIVKEVKLFNILGQEVYKGDTKEVSTAYLPYGVYVLHVVTNKNTYVQRILKK